MPDYSSDCFLVGAFPLREKCPTIAVTVYFLQTTTLTLIGPLFKNNPETTKPPKAKSRQGKLSPKVPPFQFLLFQGNLQNRTCLKGPLDFFRHCATFFENFFNVSKGSLLRVF